MTPRFTDQDVAQLYCDMRDRVLALPTLSWWQRLLDWWTPARATARRLAAIEMAYRLWQEAHQPPYEAPIAPLNSRATGLALDMVRKQRRGEHYAEPRQVEVHCTPTRQE